jgi:hypothetical protein
VTDDEVIWTIHLGKRSPPGKVKAEITELRDSNPTSGGVIKTQASALGIQRPIAYRSSSAMKPAF